MVDTNTLYSLAESLRARHLNNEERFVERYGRDAWDKFGGMQLIIRKFLKELENDLST